MEQDMIYIDAICREGSFSRAAKKLYVTQPALSAAVKRVEAAIGESIFDRARHPPVLTEAGRIYVEQIRKIAALERETAIQIDELSHMQRGKLCLGATTYFNACVLPPVLKRFSDLYPNIEIQLLEKNSAQLIQHLTEGDTDVIFNCQENDQTLFDSQEVFQDYLLLAVPAFWTRGLELDACALDADMVARRRYLDPKFPCAPLEKFSQLPFLLLTEGNNLTQRVRALFQQAGCQPMVKMSVEQLMTAYHLSCAGLGAVFVSAQIVLSGRAQDMAYYKIGSPLIIRRFQAVTPKARYVPRAVKELIRIMQGHYME